MEPVARKQGGWHVHPWGEESVSSPDKAMKCKPTAHRGSGDLPCRFPQLSKDMGWELARVQLVRLVIGPLVWVMSSKAL